MIASGHRTAAGYRMTARMRLADGTPVVLEVEGPDEDEVQRQLLAKVNRWFNGTAEECLELLE